MSRLARSPRTLLHRRTRSAFRGCLLGGAIGDALGAPVEFMKLPEIRRRFGPAEAEEWGLVQQVVAPDQLQQTALDLAHEIARNAPLAVQGVKRAVNFVAYRGFNEAAKYEAMASSVLWSSEDVYKGFAAKARKEQAEFDGK